LLFARALIADEIEFQVQLGKPTQDVGRDVLVATAACRAVVRLADPDVRGAVEQTLEPDPGLGAGQRRAGTAVDSAAEGEVLAGVLAIRVEGVRILEAASASLKANGAAVILSQSANGSGEPANALRVVPPLEAAGS